MKFSMFDFPRSGYVWCVKNQMFMFVAKLGVFRIQQELSKPKSNLIPFKGNNKAKSLFKKVGQIVSCRLFQDIYIKNIVFLRLSIQGNGVT